METTYQFECLNCHLGFRVTESEAAVHGWTFSSVQHLACTAIPASPRDVFDWSVATDGEINEMVAQMKGTENYS